MSSKKTPILKCPDCGTKAELVLFSEFDNVLFVGEGSIERYKIEPQDNHCDTCQNAFDADSFWYDSEEECLKEWNKEWIK
jgi:spore maturation protein CgeB